MFRAPTLARRAVVSVPRSRAFTDYSPADDPATHLRNKPKEVPRYKVVETHPVVEDGKERSAIFGAYPTRKKLNRAAARVAAKPDRSEAWRQDPICKLPASYSPTRPCPLMTAVRL